MVEVNKTVRKAEMDLLNDHNLQKLEINCRKKLSLFVNKLNQSATTLKQHAADLKSIATDLLVKSQQIEKLEQIG